MPEGMIYATPYLGGIVPEKHTDNVVVVDREDVLGAEEGLWALDSGGHPGGQALGIPKHAPCLGPDIPQLLRVGVGQEGQPHQGNSHLVIRAPRGRSGVGRGLRDEVVREPHKRTPNIAALTRSNGQVWVVHRAVTGILPAVRLRGEVVVRHNNAGYHWTSDMGPFPK